MFEEFMRWLMTEGTLQHSIWFAYVTFHDLIQWSVVSIIGLTAWGQRKHRQELQEIITTIRDELTHVHDEVHTHISEDAALHEDLGQVGGMTKGEDNGPS